ncbi:MULTISPECIES: hypothetical protein [Streptomyces]|uniref:Uncharacterized protein n=2 Tax=Streptomyces rimosus subsp. rimosus TaxID=132474 RepID=L8EFJ4_STRR1|nr:MULTISPECIES: hypothetical protein [Streptomyces]KOG77805.1 hypothetical protein ADK78_08625 [Kitasatospora aureofaciens]MYT45070.1 hypothetical protein [Streptomyces sp. SID5471]KEF06698.1 hypothetical protein DF17_13090 [Streptomyces rimosus]KEF16844.1 hypothetical protein DF18_32780 [Streptomyces rimosus]KUJ43295.1 hypothetical protein ADK46_02035 [Streptomyces rimosus subsp. rimosus]
MPDDLGFDKLLDDDGLLARLLGKTRAGRNRKPLYGPDLPVVLLVGGPGMGKGRLLRCVRGEFGRHVPTAHVDCDLTMYREQAEQQARTRSVTTEVLREVARQFGAWQGDGGPVATPRLYAGLAAVAASDPLADTATLVSEVQRHDELLPRGSFWRGVLNRAGRAYAGVVAGLVAHPGAVPFINAVLDELLARTSQEGKAVLAACYGEYTGAGGHPKLGLHSLASHFQQGGEAREVAEGFLFRALRADLEAAYVSLLGRLSRAGRPALLLDHADNALGRRLLKPVLEDRERGLYDRLVVMATARRADGGRFLYHAGDPAGTGDDAPVSWRPTDGGLPQWSRPAGGVPGLTPLSRGVLLVRMPVLTRDQQSRETARLQMRQEGAANAARFRIDSGIHRLSGGRPLFVSRLGEATASLSFREPDDGTDWALLDARVRAGEEAEGRPVADLLLDELISRQPPEDLPPEQRGHWLDLLSHLSVAHDTACAQVLMREVQAGRDERLSAYRIAELLGDSGWPHCPRHFIGDLGLRRLLMRRLHRLRPDGAAWRGDHLLLRDHYRALDEAATDEHFGSAAAHAMHHHLAAAGDADTVTDYLDRTFLTRSARQWCEELLAIGEAPLLGGPDDRRARALGDAEIAGDVRRKRIDRLLHAVRLCEDRTQTLDDAVTDTLPKLLERLGEEPEAGAGTLTHTARDFSDRLAGKQPLRPCTCTRHIG